MKNKLGYLTYNEIMDQNKAWERVLEDKAEYKEVVKQLANKEIEKVLFVGCGSSYYIALSGSFVFKKLTGVESVAIPASELLLFSEVYLNQKGNNLIFAVSRSGKTTEVLESIKELEKENIYTVGLTCEEESELANLCNYSLFSHDGKEKSMVMTRSFTSLLLAIQLFSALWADNNNYIAQLKQLSGCFADNIHKWNQNVEDFVTNNHFKKYEFLGQGNFYGIASESMLKMKEMAISVSEDFHSLEFRHGPKSIIGTDTLITNFIGQKYYASEIKLCKELAGYGANLFLVAEQIKDELIEPGITVEFNSGLEQLVLAPLAVVPAQLLAYYEAVKRNIDVDTPRYLSKVVENI